MSGNVKVYGTLALAAGLVCVLASGAARADMMQAIGEPEGVVDIVAWPGYIERGEIRPLVARTFALQDVAEAQAAFMEKTHVGNYVLVPPGVET